MKVLELFSGTHSVGKICKEKGYEVITLDLFNADINTDILNWDYQKYDIGYFDIIWSSPPCIEYSSCLTTRPRRLEYADSIVLKTLEIINYFKPTYWYLENPYTGLLKKREIMKGYKYFVIDYCKYGYNYRKRTIIFTNNTNYTPKSLCKQDCISCINGKHIGHFGTSSSSCNTAQKYSIPSDFLREIFLEVDI